MNLLRPRSWSLMAKVPLTITLVALGSALVIGLIIIQQDWARQREALANRTLLLTQTTAATATGAILRTDVWALYRSLKQVARRSADGPGDPLVAEAVFLDSEGIVLAHIDPANNPVGLPLSIGDESEARLLAHALESTMANIVPERLQVPGFVDAVVPITMDGTTIGVLMLRSSTAPLQTQLRQDAMTILAVALGLALFASALGTLASRRMVAPLQALSDGLDTVARGDIEAARSVPVLDRDEVGILAEQFNRMIRELAEKKRLERELANAERLAGLGRFAAGLAHEVNNPLGGMLNCVSMLRKRPDDQALVKKYVPLLETGLTRISATMQALLGELRGESSTQPCKLGCMVDLEAMVRSEIGDRPIMLDWRVRIDELGGAAVDCTCPHVHQIVLNLARNAVQAMTDGGRLDVATRRDDDTLIIEVADTGPGLDEAVQRQVFEPFYSTGQGGTGLGLWITYRLIERMGGRIAIESAPGEGARFTVALPLSRAVEPEDVSRAA
ncbi:MAG: sensor histidine kinase [Paracoccaceae bacterium]